MPDLPESLRHTLCGAYESQRTHRFSVWSEAPLSKKRRVPLHLSRVPVNESATGNRRGGPRGTRGGNAREPRRRRGASGHLASQCNPYGRSRFSRVGSGSPSARRGRRRTAKASPHFTHRIQRGNGSHGHADERLRRERDRRLSTVGQRRHAQATRPGRAEHAAHICEKTRLLELAGPQRPSSQRSMPIVTTERFGRSISAPGP